MTTTTENRPPQSRWVSIVGGVVSIVLGFMLILMPGVTLALALQIVGIYWFVMGVVAIVQLMLGTTEAPWPLQTTYAILAILVGLILMAYPFATAIVAPAILVIIVGLAGMAAGVIAVFQAMRGAGWERAGLGVVGFLIGLFVLISPYLVVVVLIWLIGLGAISGGFVAIFDGLRGRG